MTSIMAAPVNNNNNNLNKMELDVDVLLCKILCVGIPGSKLEKTVRIDDLMQLNFIAKKIFSEQPVMLELNPPVKIGGDTHGQFADVLRIFDRLGFPPICNYLFLGDYVDRGHYNIEVVSMFFCYKILYPNNFFLLRGNHECRAINRVYGFYAECQRRFTVDLWNLFQETFSYMPVTALIAKRILCMHGGLSPGLKKVSQLRAIKRPFIDPNPGLVMDILWSDPDKGTIKFGPNQRGVSFVFGPDAVATAIRSLKIDMIVRAHQVVQDGYLFFADKRLVTIFSAPHYCGQFDNAAALLNVDDNLCCYFNIIRATTKNKVVTQ